MSSNLSVLRLHEGLGQAIHLLLLHTFDSLEGLGHLVESLGIRLNMRRCTYLVIMLSILLILLFE